MVGAHAQYVGTAGRPAQLGEVGAATGELASGFRAVGGDDEHLVPPRRFVGVRQQAAIGRPRRGSDVAARFVDHGDVDAGGEVGDVQARAVEVVAVEQRRGHTRRVRGHLGLAPIAVAASEQHRPRITDVDHGEHGRLVPLPAPVDGDHQPAVVEPHRRRPVAQRRRRTAPCRGDDHLAVGGEGDPRPVRRDLRAAVLPEGSKGSTGGQAHRVPTIDLDRPHVGRVAVEGEGD